MPAAAPAATAVVTERHRWRAVIAIRRIRIRGITAVIAAAVIAIGRRWAVVAAADRQGQCAENQSTEERLLRHHGVTSLEGGGPACSGLAFNMVGVAVLSPADHRFAATSAPRSRHIFFPPRRDFGDKIWRAQMRDARCPRNKWDDRLSSRFSCWRSSSLSLASISRSSGTGFGNG